MASPKFRQSNLAVNIVVVAVITLASFLIYKLKRQSTSIVPSDQQLPTPTTSTAKTTRRNRPRNWKFIVAQTVLGLISVCIGLVLTSLTRSPISIPSENPSMFTVGSYFDPGGGATDEDVQAGRDFDVYLTITVRPNEKDADVFMAIQRKKILWNIRDPKFRVVWPGRIAWAGLNKDVANQFYELNVNDIGSIISTKTAEYPILEFTWFDAITSVDSFRKQISLKVADRVDGDVKQEGWERAYRIVILPKLPSNTIVTYSSPTLENLEKGITVVDKTASIDDYDYSVASNNFEVTYENTNAEDQRNLLFLTAGITFGIAGNFFVNAITALTTPKHELEDSL